MNLAATLEAAASAANRRVAGRRTLNLSLSADNAGDRIDIRVRDISRSGMMLEVRDGALAVADRLSIDLPEGTPVKARVAWLCGAFVGCAFDHQLTNAAVSALLLRSLPAGKEIGDSIPVISVPKAGFAPEISLFIPAAAAAVFWAVAGLLFSVA